MMFMNINNTSHCPKIQLTFPFKDATKTLTTEISSQGGVGDTLVRSQWNSDMNPIQAVLFSTRQTEQFTRRQEYLHERCNYFSSESVLFCLFKQKKKKKERGTGLADNSKCCDLKRL